MKKATITISYDEEKLAALRLYLDQKNQSLEAELTTATETLYQKTVPGNVRDFINLLASAEKQAERKKKQKASPSPAVGIDAREVNADE